MVYLAHWTRNITLITVLLVIPCTGFAQQHFTDCIASNANDATVILPSDTVVTYPDGDRLQEGDEIALYSEDGRCAGVAVWDSSETAASVSVADRDTTAGILDGYESEESLEYRIWRSSDEQEYEVSSSSYSCSLPHCRSDGLYERDGIYEVSLLTLNSGVSQMIALNAGWNVISSDVAPKPEDIDSVFAGVSVSIVKDEDDNVFIPDEDRNEIGVWDSTDAYKVYTDSDQSLTVKGEAVADTVAIPLQKGWNLVPYRPNDSLAVDVALESISNELVIVKNEVGETYVPAYGIDQIGALRPSEGYQVYVEASTELVYPTGL